MFLVASNEHHFGVGVATSDISVITAGQRGMNVVQHEKMTSEESIGEFHGYGRNQVTMTQVPILLHL